MLFWKSEKDKLWAIEQLAKLASKQDRADDYVKELSMRLLGLDPSRDAEEIATWITQASERIWRLSEGTTAFRERFFSDLYAWLYACCESPGLVIQVLDATSGILARAAEKYASLKHHREFCDNLKAIIQCDDMIDCPANPRECLTRYLSLTDTLRAKASESVGIETAGAQYLYDFARRLQALLEAKDICEIRRDFGSCPLPAIEAAHAFLDRLSTSYPPPVQYVARVLNRNNWANALGLSRLPLAERKLCEWLLEEMRQARLVPSVPEIALVVDAPVPGSHGIKIRGWNTGSQALRIKLNYGFRADEQAPGSFDHSLSLQLARYETGVFREIPVPKHCAAETICYLDVKMNDGAPRTWAIAPGARYPAADMPEKVVVPHFDMRYSEANQRWLVFREGLLAQVFEPLEDVQKLKAGSARWLCGLPRSGKTSLLRLIKQRAEELKLSVSYADLQRLVPLLPQMNEEQRDTWIRGFLRDILDELAPAKTLEAYDTRCATLDYLDVFKVYNDILYKLAKEAPRLILIDEFGEVLRDLEKYDPKSLKALIHGLGINLKAEFPNLPLHFILCVDDAFFTYSPTHWAYQLLSSLDPQPLYVGRLTREEIEELMNKPFAACGAERVWFDDRALAYLEAYTGGQPLFLQLISRDLARLVRDGALFPPFSDEDMYRVLESPLTQDGSDFYNHSTRLRDALTRAARLIWDSLSAETKRRLGQVLSLSTLAYVNDLQALNLLNLAPNGQPELGGALLHKSGADPE